MVAVELKFAEERRLLQAELQQALVVRATNTAGAAVADLTAAKAALQAQFDQATAALQARYSAGVNAAEGQFRDAEAHSSAEHCEELQRVISSQRLAFR